MSSEYVCVGCKYFRFADGEMVCIIDGDADECDTQGREEYARQDRRKLIPINEEE